jgi:hypothetical protein
MRDNLNYSRCIFLATYTVLYSENDPSALAKYQLWTSVGYMITYSVSFPLVFCFNTKKNSSELFLVY